MMTETQYIWNILKENDLWNVSINAKNIAKIEEKINEHFKGYYVIVTWVDNLIVADSGGFIVRVISPAGIRRHVVRYGDWA